MENSKKDKCLKKIVSLSENFSSDTTPSISEISLNDLVASKTATPGIDSLVLLFKIVMFWACKEMEIKKKTPHSNFISIKTSWSIIN